MVEVYCTLIIAGVRTYAKVPTMLKSKVKEALIAMGLEELVAE